MLASRLPVGRITVSNGRSFDIYPPTPVLSEALCDLEESKPGDNPVIACLLAMNLVATHCLSLPDMSCTGGPPYWPGIVSRIVSTWPDDGPWPEWSGFIGMCVEVFVEDLIAPMYALNPTKLRAVSEEVGRRNAAEWLARWSRDKFTSAPTPPPPPAIPPAFGPVARAYAAVAQLLREGKTLSLKAICQRAGVDRANLRNGYPEVWNALADQCRPDRPPRRGVRDKRTGRIEAMDDE
jgi:hypothetical protein